VEILDLRHFRSADLRPLMEEESAVWSKELDWDYGPSAEMILRYLDARILPGYAAVEEGSLAGYTFFVYEGSKGIIGDLFVRPGAEENGSGASQGEPRLGERLLSHVIETLQNSPGIHRIEAQLLPHPAGSLARPFTQGGFQRHPRLFMNLALSRARDWPSPGRSKAAEIEIRPWSDADFHSAAAVITAAYRDHVDADINDQYRTLSGSLRFLNNIVRFPGCGLFDPGSSRVAVDKASKSAVGLILCSQVKEGVGHITQVCVVPEHRGAGTGEALVAASAANLESRGFHTLSLTVTEANTRAVGLYRRLNFEQTKVFDAFVWEG
jgi:ribosomal protein S18 acetylase RimI-like enzyme